MNEYPDPIPPPSIDPTRLTTEALRREIALLEISVQRRIASVEAEIDVRLNSTQELRDEQFKGMQERFLRVQKEFELIERQRVEQKKDTKDAVDAALTAQKEAVKEQTTASSLATAKSETATLKQIEQLQTTFTTAIEALRRSIDEVKERISDETRNLRQAISDVERRSTGSDERQVGALQGRNALYAGLAALGVLVSIGAVLIAVVR
jgi:DNA repair exonuclease SbcCD ATPase subunit